MKTLEITLKILAVLWVLVSIISVIYIDVHYRRFLKKYGIHDEKTKKVKFSLKILGISLASIILSVVGWPIAFIFHKFPEQERLDEMSVAGRSQL